MIYYKINRHKNIEGRLRGLALAACLAVFITSLIFSISFFSGALRENYVTGAVIGGAHLSNISFVAMIVSASLAALIILSYRKRH